MKVCYKCKNLQEENKFGVDSSKKDGLNIYCKSCKRSKENSYKGFVSGLKSKYNLTIENYNYLLIKQNNKCRICYKNFDNNVRPNVDHCHTSNLIRGLLCQKCNTGLGFVNDNPEILKNMIMYLNETEYTTALNLVNKG